MIIIIFLVVWTELDPPRLGENRSLDRNDGSIILVDPECRSNSNSWEIGPYAWNAVLLILCAFLAFQSRKSTSIVNDSRAIATMVYSQFLFFILRLLAAYFDGDNTFSAGTVAAIHSIVQSLDAFFAMAIYLMPKIIKAAFSKGNDSRGGAGSDSTRQISTSENSELEFKILACTANMGNAEPVLKSMETWIPSDGACSAVTPLEGITSLQSGYFDLIVIGMQEATWKANKDDTTKTIRGEEITEEEILNSLQRPDSATIRQQTQDILGGDYIQVRFSVLWNETVLVLLSYVLILFFFLNLF